MKLPNPLPLAMSLLLASAKRRNTLVQIIKTPDTFQCQTCGEVYEHLWQAELCEAQPVKELDDYPIGCKVKVQSRYDGLVNSCILGLCLRPKYAPTIKSSQSLDKHLQKFFNDFSEQHHEVVFLISDAIEMGKDDFRNWVYKSEVTLDGSTI